MVYLPRQKYPPGKEGMGEKQKKGPAATYSPTVARSTIGVRVLNFRVRDGNGCVHPAVATGPANAWEREGTSHDRPWRPSGLER